MKENIIIFETAKLGKEKGFNIKCSNGFRLKAEQIKELSCKNNINFNGGEWNPDDEHIKYYSAPNQTILQKWLREEHKLRVFVKQGVSGNFNYEIYKWNYDNVLGIWERIGNISSVDSYEIALENGMYHALTLIKK